VKEETAKTGGKDLCKGMSGRRYGSQVQGLERVLPADRVARTQDPCLYTPEWHIGSGLKVHLITYMQVVWAGLGRA
jgi:hypothetical protein